MKAPAPVIDRLLPFNVAVVSILGIIMLGLGQRDLSLVVAGIVAVVVSLVVTDLKRWVLLNRMLANVAAIVAVGFSVRDFLKFDQATQLLAIANLLIYLQIVLLFQQKLLRVYWQILVLSLLQVVVGTALNMGVGFGVMMAVYLFFMLTAMMLLHIRRQALRYGPRASELDASARETYEFDTAPALAARTGPIQVLPSAPAALGQRLAQTGILRHSLTGSFTTVVVAALLFFALPRSDENVWTPVSTSDTLTGFTSTVSLHSFGSILDNEELVMRVAFRNENDREKIYQIHGEPLLRGTVLNHYARGEWSHKSNGPPSRERRQALPVRNPRLEAALQQITIEPLSEPVLFGAYPLYRLNERQRLRGLRWDDKRIQLTRTEDLQDERVAYETLTTAFRQGKQRAVIPEVPFRWPGDRAQHLQLPYTEWMSAASVEGMPTRRTDVDPLDDLPELAATAARQIAAAGIDRSNPRFKVNAARALARYLHDTPRFVYTLAHVPRDPAIDPIEDFIRNNPRGHCEYFASALALMLRTQGIPTRMAVGFKGGEYNQVGGFFQVRQMHAHAWVEVYLEPAEIPAGDGPREGEAPAGWLVLDPTPREDDGDALAETGFLAALGDLGEYMQHWWTTYVIGLNADRQRELYQPLTDITDAAEELSDESGPRRWMAVAAAWLKSDAFTLRGATIVAYLALLALVGVRLSARALSRVRWPVFWSRTRRGAKARERIDFYDRLERLLARYGFRRQETQTPLEFALATGAELVVQAELRPAATLPRRIVEAYYRVRFGRHPLDSRELGFVEQQLAELDAALRQLQRRG